MYRFQPIAEGSHLQAVAQYDCLTGISTPGSEHIATKGYIVSMGILTLGVVFQTEECGKQWVAIDATGYFWTSFGNTRQHAADWLMKRARG